MDGSGKDIGVRNRDAEAGLRTQASGVRLFPRPGRPSRRTADAVSSIRFAHASASATPSPPHRRAGSVSWEPVRCTSVGPGTASPPAAVGEIPASGNQGRVLATTTCGRSGDILNR
jgi:hypothetical protein